MRLWFRLAAVTALVSITVLLVTGFVAMETATRQAQLTSEEILRREAAGDAEVVSRWLDEHLAFLEALPRLFRADQITEVHQVNLLRAVYGSIDSLVTVVLLDAEGRPLVQPQFLEGETATGLGRLAGSAEHSEELVEVLPWQAARAGKGVVGAPLRWQDQVTLPVVVVASVDPLGQPTTYLGAELRLDVLDDILAKSNAEHGLAVLGGEGQPLRGGDHRLVDAGLLKPLLQTGASFDYQLPSGERVSGEVAPIRGTAWTLVVAEPSALVERAAREIRARTVLIMSGAVVFALLVAAGVARSVVEPVGQLRNSALRVADGQFGHQTDVERADELGELAKAFNHMSLRLSANAEELAEQRAQIEAFNAELQERVAAATSELRDAQAQLVRSGQLAAVAEIGAGLAHELNNPLAGILGTLQLLRATSQGSEAELLQAAEAEAQRCREVVAAMLRLNDTRVDPESVPVVELTAVVQDVVSVVSASYRSREVSLVVDALSHPWGEVRAEPAALSRALMQLFTAILAGLSAGDVLHVQPLESGMGVRCEAQLTGSERVDDYQAASLGLWVVRRMLDELGGRLDGSLEQGVWDVHLRAADA